MTLALGAGVVAADGLLHGVRLPADSSGAPQALSHRCLAPDRAVAPSDGLSRKTPWSLPSQALAADFDTTIHILVLRFNFQYEAPDDPNTTGRGRIDVSNPKANAQDSASYYDSVGHWIDPPPHDSEYFDAHLRALRTYWEFASEQKVTMSWDIFPNGRTAAYELPHPMAYYGLCDSVVIGLERFFTDCITLADADNAIDFAQYQAVMIFHAGADRQNDIGFPTTCSDLFTGFIVFGDSVAVDGGSRYIRRALLMPETSCQDNRATALNAVMAHEFGHQLGLVDLYSSATFMTQLGDFSLMDDNGFGSGIDFGYPVGRVFGSIPVYPDAWSRAYLGYVPVVDFRQGSDIRLVAAQVASSGIKIARIPISEKEYYLIENRIEDVDGMDTYARVDTNTNVILGPADSTRRLNGEYDFLLPGYGMLIYHVDEAVAGLDYDGDGQNNFDDNDLQWDAGRRFISLVEADGVVDFGGYYRRGYGSPEDLFRDDRATAFTPNTNPPTIDNSGNQTHIYITDIRRDTTRPAPSEPLVRMDSVMRFDIETRGLVSGFPVRTGSPQYGLNVIADDLDRDGTEDVVVASGKLVSAFTTTGGSYLQHVSPCPSCPVVYDTAYASTNPGTPHIVPLLIQTPEAVSASPVTGDFGVSTGVKMVAVGYPLSASGRVLLLRAEDANTDGVADIARVLTTAASPIALSFGRHLFALDAQGHLYRLTTSGGTLELLGTFANDEYNGLCRIGDRIMLSAGDSLETKLYYVGAAIDSVALGGYYPLGPISADLDRDGIPQIVVASYDGEIASVVVDTSAASKFGAISRTATGQHFTVNPVIGDVDRDGLADIVIGGTNGILVYDHHLLGKSNFPLWVDDRYPTIDVIAPPVVADIDHGVTSEIVFPTDIGNVYSFGRSNADLPIPGAIGAAAGTSSQFSLTHGFPLSAGEKGAGSPVILSDSTGGKLGFQGADGWFYLWEVDADPWTNYWPMGGADPAGSYAISSDRLGDVRQWGDGYLADRFYSYPNPVTDGRTHFRYFLGEAARTVQITVYDLSGQEVTSFAGSTLAGENEQTWDCSGVTPGVYRCRVEVDFGSSTKTEVTDVAVIR